MQPVHALHELAPARVAGVAGRFGTDQGKFRAGDAADLADADPGADLGRPGVLHFHAVETRQQRRKLFRVRQQGENVFLAAVYAELACEFHFHGLCLLT